MRVTSLVAINLYTFTALIIKCNCQKILFEHIQYFSHTQIEFAFISEIV